MKHALVLSTILGISALGLAGCGGEENETEEKATVQTPEGKTEKTVTEKVEKTGANPPPTPDTPAAK